MSNSNNTVKPGEFQYATTNSAGAPPLNEKQMKVRYAEALSALEKQHRLQKLQAEMALYRLQEVQANIQYMQVMQQFNQAKEDPNKPQESTTGEAPKEEQVQTTSKLETDEPSY